MRDIKVSIALVLFFVCLVFLLLGGYTAGGTDLHRTGTSSVQELVLPPLPADAVKVLSMNNSGVGVCVSYVTKSGEARMVQYTFSDGVYSLDFVYRFQPTR